MILTSLFTFAGQAEAPARGQGSLFTALIPFILVFVIFYLLIIMPQRKRQKRHQEMVQQLKPGEKIITTGGIHGTVMGVQQDKIEVKIASNVKIDISKNAVAAVLSEKKETK
jgi:preprotein translocase subunit YajC